MRKLFRMTLSAAICAAAAICIAPTRAADPKPTPVSSPAAVPVTESAKRVTVPEGFNVTLFAGEPDVVQPIAFTFDHRGRMWVVECRSYPKWIKDDKTEGTDSIVILEDTDGDGKFDKRTVFADKLRNVSAIELGFGGVWLGAIPYLQYIPIKEGEDKPAGPAQNLLDGWNVNEVKHNIFSSFTWGPDGWLWATNGIQSKSKIGKPGTPDDERVKFDCGVWRYHPTKHLFEVVAVGTTNPWGLDFDENGQCFITNCVIAHLWHVIPGAYYTRMYGQHYNPYHYGYMQSCADHLHWETGKAWTDSRAGAGGKTSEAGGGHAHIGAMIYQGSNWPAEYRNKLYTCNLHGNRMNCDNLVAKGSGYVATHGKDFAFWNDPWFRGLAVKQGPDGAVYVSDWSDTGECHNYDKVDPSNGRIYKISYGKPAVVKPDLAKMTDSELFKMAAEGTDSWWSRQAQLTLQERAVTRPLPWVMGGDAIFQGISDQKDPRVRLRALWVSYRTGAAAESIFDRFVGDENEYVRGWAIRFAVEDRKPSDAILTKMLELEKSDPSPVVRLHLASALQRIPVEQRWDIAEALSQHGEDKDDQNLPLMNWFAFEPLVQADMPRALEIAAKSKLQTVRQYAARRAADGADEKGLAAVTVMLGKVTDPDAKRDILRGMSQALSGMRKAPLPSGWPEVFKKLNADEHGDIRDAAASVALIFGDGQAIAALREAAADKNRDPRARQSAVQALVNAKEKDLLPMLYKLLDDRDVRTAVIRGLASAGDDTTPAQLLKRYDKFVPDERIDVVQTLASRPAFASALLDAVGQGTVAKADLSAAVVRQIAGMNDKQVKEKLEKKWGTIRPPEKDKAAKIAQLKKQFKPDVLKDADLSNGRALFTKTCAQCHTLFDAGGKVGPNLTGSQRAVLDYVLENIVDPSAVVAKEFRMVIVDTKDDRNLTGIVVAESEKAVTIRTTNEDITIPVNEIAKRKDTPLSMMPEGLLDTMKPEEQRDLIAYLASPQQVPEKK